MGLLGRIFGRKPADPPGTTYVIDGGALVGSPFRVMRVLPGQTSGSQKYLDSLEGGLAYRYPPAAA